MRAACGQAMSPPAPDTPEHLVALLEAAGRTLMSAAVRGLRPGGVRSFWPEILRSAEEIASADVLPARGPTPSAGAITAMDTAHAWIRLIPLDPPRPGACERHSPHGGAMLRRIVWARSLVHPVTGRHVYSWRKLGQHLGCSHESARSWHAQAIGQILARLAPARPVGRQRVALTTAARLGLRVVEGGRSGAVQPEKRAARSQTVDVLDAAG